MLSAVTDTEFPDTRAKYLHKTSSYGFKPKGKSAFHPISINFPFIHPEWYPTHPITLLSLPLLPFQVFKRSLEGKNIQKTEKKRGSFSIKLLRKQARVAVANHKRVECHLLVHNLSSLVF